MAAIVMIGFSGCKKAADDTNPVKGTTKSDVTIAGMCGTSQSCPLTAGQTINSGTLTISNDATNLYVTYTIDPSLVGSATFGTLHLWLGTDFTLLPRASGSGAPIPGQFPYIVNASSLTTYTFTIPIANIPSVKASCGDLIYVVAHAEMVGGSVDGQTAFGGCTAGTDSPRWYFYSTYTTQCCTTPPPDNGNVKLGTAFAKGGYVFTTDPKSNPEKLPSLKLTTNRWGWANNLLIPGSITKDLWVGAGLNNTSKGIKVGSATITWDGANATVTYNLNSPYTLEEVHTYAGDFKPTTLAPGQYGNIAYLDPHVPASNTYTFSNIPVSDTNGDGAWFIVHAVVWGPGVTNP